MSYHDYVTRYQIEALGLTSTMFASDLPTKGFLDRPAPQPGVNQQVRHRSSFDGFVRNVDLPAAVPIYTSIYEWL
jgi:hypothetical protein